VPATVNEVSPLVVGPPSPHTTTFPVTGVPSGLRTHTENVFVGPGRTATFW